MKRYAIVRNTDSRRQVEAYLPDNYRVIGEVVERVSMFASTHHDRTDRMVYVIQGEDRLGWSLDLYVIPRLASGLIMAEEIDLSHPVMKCLEVNHDRFDSELARDSEALDELMDRRDDVASVDTLARALATLILDRRIRAFLESADPNALEQARQALNLGVSA